MIKNFSKTISGVGMSHLVREKETERIQKRRRNLIYLIAEFLRERGFENTVNMLYNEANLSLDIEICDNINLDTIISDYYEYYYVKYNKYPNVCKKNESSNSNCNEIRKNKRGELSRTNITLHAEEKVKPKSIQQKDNDFTSINDLNSTIIVKSVSALENQNTNKNEEQLPESNMMYDKETFLKSIESLYESFTEYKEIAYIIYHEIVLRNLNTSWTDIKGLNDSKVLLKESTVYPLKYPKIFNTNLGFWKGVLLYGPPGTGKTMLAKAVATECHATFFNITPSCVISKWRGDSEKYVRVLMELASYFAPSIIFIDEIDWATTNKGDSISHCEPFRRFRSELLSRLDGLLSNDCTKVILLATTNVPWNIDIALLRRLEKRIFINLPDEETREEILKSYTIKKLHEMDEFRSLIKSTTNYSCADLKLLCREAWMNQLRPLYRSLESNEISSIDIKNDGIINEIKHLIVAMRRVKPIGNYLVDDYEKWNQCFGSETII